jgi:hypothetical protein
MKDELFIGIDDDNQLISLDFDFERNERNKDVSISSTSYSSPITEEEGIENAKERFADPEYWIEAGLIDRGCPDVIIRNIDWDAVAEEVISSDGWENTNGEYQNFGCLNDEEIYIGVNGGGQSTEFFDKPFTNFIPRQVLTRIMEIWAIYHIQNPPNYKEILDELKSYVDKYTQLTDRQFVLELYSSIKDLPQDEVVSFKVKHLTEEYTWDLSKEINSEKVKKILLLESI